MNTFVCALTFLFIVASTLGVKSPNKNYELFLEKIGLCDEGAGRNLLDISKLNVTISGTDSAFINGFITLTGERIESPLHIDIKILSLAKHNERDIGFRSHVEFCDLINTDKTYVPQFQSKTDFPKSCPIPPGKYSVNGVTLKAGTLPKSLHHGCYRMELEISKFGRILSCVALTAKITEPNGNPFPKCS